MGFFPPFPQPQVRGVRSIKKKLFLPQSEAGRAGMWLQELSLGKRSKTPQKSPAEGGAGAGVGGGDNNHVFRFFLQNQQQEMVKFRLLFPKQVSVGASEEGESLKFEAKPPKIGGGRYWVRPSPILRLPPHRDPREGMGEGRRFWGDFDRFGAGGAWGTPPDVACGHLPTPNSPQNRRKTATIGQFDRFGRFSPQTRFVLTGFVCVGGVSWVFFAAPAGPAPPPEEPSRARLGQKNPKTGSAGTVGSQKLVFVPLSPQNGPLQGWKGRGSFGFGCFPPQKKTPKLLKLPQNALLAGPAPSWEFKTKNKAFSTQKSA